MHMMVIKMELKLMRHKVKQQGNYGEHVRCSHVQMGFTAHTQTLEFCTFL